MPLLITSKGIPQNQLSKKTNYHEKTYEKTYQKTYENNPLILKIPYPTPPAISTQRKFNRHRCHFVSRLTSFITSTGFSTYTLSNLFTVSRTSLLMYRYFILVLNTVSPFVSIRTLSEKYMLSLTNLSRYSISVIVLVTGM